MVYNVVPFQTNIRTYVTCTNDCTACISAWVCKALLESEQKQKEMMERRAANQDENWEQQFI